jgi:hypothetical protein
MTFDDAVSCVVSRREAEQEIAAHGADFFEFIDEVGDRSKYIGAEVLAWLGY